MEGDAKERWLELAELAAREQNPDKMVAIVEEINRILEEKERRLKASRGSRTDQA